jgi:hypothetical protein
MTLVGNCCHCDESSSASSESSEYPLIQYYECPGERLTGRVSQRYRFSWESDIEGNGACCDQYKQEMILYFGQHGVTRNCRWCSSEPRINAHGCVPEAAGSGLCKASRVWCWITGVGPRPRFGQGDFGVVLAIEWGNSLGLQQRTYYRKGSNFTPLGNNVLTAFLHNVYNQLSPCEIQAPPRCNLDAIL